MSRKVIVTGGSGLLGRAVAARLQSVGKLEVQRWVFNRLRDEKTDKKVDIAEKQTVDSAVEEFKPDVIIHCAAIRAPDIVDKQQDFARGLNVLGSQNLAESAVRHNALLIYISTDYVFDGKNPSYSETATPNPLNEYGRQKLDGERVVMEKYPDAVILRLPILYGPVEYLGEGAVDVVLKAILDRDKPVEMSDYERRYPTHVDDVAGAIQVLLERHFEHLKDPSKAAIQGIYHWSGDEEMTKNDMAKAMADVFLIPIDHVTANPNPPTSSQAAQRPYNAKLSCKRLLELGAKNKYQFKQGIESLRKFMPGH